MSIEKKTDILLLQRMADVQSIPNNDDITPNGRSFCIR